MHAAQRVGFERRFRYDDRWPRHKDVAPEAGAEQVSNPVQPDHNGQENRMSQSITFLAALGLLAAVAACAPQQEEVIIVEPEPISVEPAYTGKYK